MAEIVKLGVVHQDEKAAREVRDILAEFVAMADRGELAEVMVAGIGAKERMVFFGASGQVGITEQLGTLERFKTAILDGERERA